MPRNSVVHGVEVGVLPARDGGSGAWRRLALLGIGYRRLSITPAAVGPIKELVRKVDLAELSAAMTGWLAEPQRDLRATADRLGRGARY